ncbi:MAG: IclR family transcriptional regulator [Sporomusaceae bacterium]|nr:IclR family transcriptional regulator [Sporomusaceae bacterium]
MEDKGKNKIIQSLARAMSILEYLADCKGGDGLSNISRGLGLSKSTTHSLISTMEQLGYVHQDQISGKYALGLKIFELGQVVHASMDLRTIAMPYLHSLAQKYQETVHLAVLSRGEVVYIDKVDSPHSIRIISHVGGRNPAHCTGVGKVLLAGLPEEEMERVIRDKKLQRFTPNTVTDPVKLKAHLAKVRQEGYAEDREEIEIGLSCVAAPLKNHRGVVIAAISLSGPTGRVANGNIHDLTTDVVDAARLISAQLGYKD